MLEAQRSQGGVAPSQQRAQTVRAPLARHTTTDGCPHSKTAGCHVDDAVMAAERRSLTMGLLLLIILIVFLLGGLPRWGYHSYGWGPSGIVGVVLLVVLVLLLTGRL